MPEWKVGFYEDRRERSPVIEFLKGLSKSDQAQVRNVIRLLERHGPDPHMYPHAQKVRGKLWELRAGPHRLFYFLPSAEEGFVILHGYRKKGQKTPQREIETAERRMGEYLEGEE